MTSVLYTEEPTIASIPSVLSVSGFASATKEEKTSGSDEPAAMSVAPASRKQLISRHEERRCDPPPLQCQPSQRLFML